MSLFSFGTSSKNSSTFHAKIIIHELEDVPLLKGTFQVKWKTNHSHPIPLHPTSTSEKERPSFDATFVDPPLSAKNTTAAEQRKAHGRTHHGKVHHSVQVGETELREIRTEGKNKSALRAQRQAASEPSYGPSSASTGESDAAPTPTSLWNSSNAPSVRSRSPSAAGSIISVQPPPSLTATEAIGQQTAAASSASSINEQVSRAIDVDYANEHQVGHPQEATQDTVKGHHEMVDDEQLAPLADVDRQSRKPGKLAKLWRTIAPLASPAPSSSSMQSRSTSRSPGSYKTQTPTSAATVTGRTFDDQDRTGWPQHLVVEKGFVGSNDMPSSAPPLIKDFGSDSTQVRQNPSSIGSYISYHPHGDSNGKGKAREADSESSNSKSGEMVTTPGLDLTRQRPSLSSKHSSSHLSFSSSDGRDAVEGSSGGGNGHSSRHRHGHHHHHHQHQHKGSRQRQLSHASQTSHPSSSGAASGVLKGAPEGTSNAPQLEPKGTTDSVHVKEHTVRWERSFEVGIRIPIEKNKSNSKMGAPSNGSAGSSLQELDEDLAVVDVDGSSAGGGRLRPSRSRSNLRGKEFKESLAPSSANSPVASGTGTPVPQHDDWRERERQLAEAWGTLAKTTLRLTIKQDVETEAHQSSSHNEGDLGYVEINLAEYAPWPAPSTQAAVLAPSRVEALAHASKHRNHTLKRNETRRYLLRDSRSNAKLRVTVEMTFFGGVKEYAVPRIKRGMPVNGLGDLVTGKRMPSSTSMQSQSLSKMGDDAESLNECGECDPHGDASSCYSGSSRGTGHNKKSVRYDELSSTSHSVSLRGGPYSPLLSANTEYLLRTSIPAKNFRSTSSSSTASKHTASSYNPTVPGRNSFSSSIAERDPMSVINMIMDQAKHHASLAAVSKASSIKSATSDKTDNGSTAAISTSPSKAVGKEKKPFLFRSRKSSNNSHTKESSKDSGAFGSGGLRPRLTHASNVTNGLKASSSTVSLASLGATAQGLRRVASDAVPTLSTPHLVTESPEGLTPIPSRVSDMSEMTIYSSGDAGSRKPTNDDAASGPKKLGTLKTKMSIPNIDVSSPSGRTYPSFQPSFSSAMDDSNELLSSDTSLNRAELAAIPRRVRRSNSSPAIPDGRSSPTEPIQSTEDRAAALFGPSRPAEQTRRPSRSRKLKGQNGIAPEQAQAKGYRGVGWTKSNDDRSSRSSSMSPEPMAARRGAGEVDAHEAQHSQQHQQMLLRSPSPRYAHMGLGQHVDALSRHSSAESYASLRSIGYTIPLPPQTPPLVSGAK